MTSSTLKRAGHRTLAALDIGFGGCGPQQNATYLVACMIIRTHELDMKPSSPALVATMPSTTVPVRAVAPLQLM
jgi:hypothetical protein